MNTPAPPTADPPDIGHVMPQTCWDEIDHTTAQNATPDAELLLRHAEFLDSQR